MKLALLGEKKGLQTLYTLLGDNVYIDAICVFSKEEAYNILGKPIVLYDELKAFRDEWKIIVPPNENAEENAQRFMDDGVRAEIYSKELHKRLQIADLELDSLSVSFFLHSTKGRPIVVYGTDQRAVECVRKMELLDCKIDGFVTSEVDREYILGKPLRSVFELLYASEDIMVILATPNHEQVELLKGLGLEYGKNFCLLSSLRLNERRGNRDAVWDLNLGHIYLEQDAQIPGFMVYGSEKAGTRIVILGGSTSDSHYTWFSSWPEILWKSLALQNYDVQIINGSMCGYNVQQELIKLIRDVLLLKPDIVIDMSGTNNVGTARVSPSTPFVPYYLLNIAKELSEKKRIKYSVQSDDMKALCVSKEQDEIYCGLETNDTCAQSYIRCLRMMHALCREFGIKFHSFFQPTLWTKYPYWDNWEREINFCSSVSDLSGNQTDFRLKRAEDFVTEVKAEHLQFQTDLTGLFHFEQEVYMDTDHYTFYGNQLIAEKVELYLKEILSMG